jgi:hypothetical protein
VPASSCSSSALRNVDERIFCTYSSAPTLLLLSAPYPVIKLPR